MKKRKTKKKKIRLSRVLLLIAVVLVMFLFFELYNTFHYMLSRSSLSDEISTTVEEYEPVIFEQAVLNGIPDYTGVIKAMMMQESKGLGTDPMQASECPHNTAYDQEPGSISDPNYSIEVGVRYFADCLTAAGCTGPDDTERLKLALQGYNFGNGYIAWALERDGGYTEEGAQAFSAMMQQELGWETYGDPEYALKVLHYCQSDKDEVD